MTLQILALILISVTISATAQICLKLGMSSPVVQQALSAGGSEALVAVIANPAVLGGLFLYGCGAITWLFVLARVNVSFAYPFVGISFLLTTAFAIMFLGETVTRPMMIGTSLIVLGIAVLARA